MEMKYTKKFLKATAFVLLFTIMLASFIAGATCALVGILGICLEGNAQYLLLIPVALLCIFIGVVTIDCINALLDKEH